MFYSDELFSDSAENIESGLEFSFRVAGFNGGGDNGNVEALLASLMGIGDHQNEDI